MYHWLFKLNKDHGYATDEHDNISIVCKENEGYELEDILKKENELEELVLDLKANNESLSTLNNNKKNRLFYSIAILIVEIYMYLVGQVNYSLTYTLSMMGMMYLFTKPLVAHEWGTWIGSFTKKKKILKTIEELETKRPELVSELQRMKEVTDYQVHHESEIDWLNNGKKNYQFTGNCINRNENDKPAEVKVLCLTEKSSVK
mgnify:CR=1 FL=1